MSSNFARRFSVLILLLNVSAVGVSAQSTPPVQPASQTDPEVLQDQVLGWLDDFREYQVLFHDSDLGALRDKLAAGDVEESLRWWSESARLREAIENPHWQGTHRWFAEFLKVQAIFSDQQIAELRSRAWKAANSSSREFRIVLDEVASYRARLSRAAAGDRAIRRSQLNAIASYRDRNAYPFQTAKAAGFATNRAPVKPRQQRYSVRPPLITSLQVARWEVIRPFWWW